MREENFSILVELNNAWTGFRWCRRNEGSGLALGGLYEFEFLWIFTVISCKFKCFSKTGTQVVKEESILPLICQQTGTLNQKETPGIGNKWLPILSIGTPGKESVKTK